MFPRHAAIYFRVIVGGRSVFLELADLPEVARRSGKSTHPGFVGHLDGDDPRYPHSISDHRIDPC